MSKAAEDLIARAERESGKRYDDPDNPAGLAIIFGALTREMGLSKHDAKDDCAAGVIVQHQMTPEYEAEKRRDESLLMMLGMGFSPDQIRDMHKK